MVNKYSIAAAALRAERFTVADLAGACGMGAVSVRTVLNRLPEDWFSIRKASTGARGGQPSLYELSEEGRKGLAEIIGELPVLPPSAPPDTSPEPLGLASARETFQKLALEDSPSERVLLIQEAIADLNAAATDAVESALPNVASVLVQVDSLRARFNALRGMVTTESSMQRVSVRRPKKHYIAARGNSEHKWATLWAPPHEQLRNQRAMLPIGPQRISQRMRTLPLVLISYLAGDLRGRDFASYAVGALKTLAHYAVDPWKSSTLDVQKLELEDLLKVWELNHESVRRAVKVFVCFDSKGVALDAYRRSLEHAGEVLPKASMKLCDLGFSTWTKELAENQGVQYTCNLNSEARGSEDLFKGIFSSTEFEAPRMSLP